MLDLILWFIHNKNKENCGLPWNNFQKADSSEKFGPGMLDEGCVDCPTITTSQELESPGVNYWTNVTTCIQLKYVSEEASYKPHHRASLTDGLVLVEPCCHGVQGHEGQFDFVLQRVGLGFPLFRTWGSQLISLNEAKGATTAFLQVTNPAWNHGQVNLKAWAHLRHHCAHFLQINTQITILDT